MPRLVYLVLLGAAVVAGGSRPSPCVGLEKLRYNHPGLVVDLGVGLWAWPVPCDADGDGDFDLIVSCPDKPSNGVWLFENTTGDTAKDKFPVFKPARRLSPTVHYVMPSYVEGNKLRVLTPGFEYPEFVARGLETRHAIAAPADFHKPLGNAKGVRNKIRHNQWRYADYDGDGRLDLVVGIEDWSDYGWDDAFDAQGRWTNGPLHGFVYWLRNVGRGAEEQFDEPQKVAADGQPVDTYGCPSPNFEDFDGDGDLDLLCGEFLDGFSYFENVGTRTQPRYSAGKRIRRGDVARDAAPSPGSLRSPPSPTRGEGKGLNRPDAKSDRAPPASGLPPELEMDLQMIVPVAFDWDRDGDLDLVVGQEDGRVALLENTGRLAADRVPVFLPPRFFQQQADELKCGALATPVGCDWDGDGDTDIVSGNTAGYIEWFENLSGPRVERPKWAAPRRLSAGDRAFRIMAGPNGSIQGPCEAKWGYTTLSVADWDADGLPDILFNSILGRVSWLRNVGMRAAPRLAEPQPIEVAWSGSPPKPAWTWWSPRGNELATQWRTTPVVHDFNGDGLADLAMLDHEGFLAYFERARRDGQLVLLPPRRAFVDETGQPLRLNDKRGGGSGRRKLCIVDWDGDGRFDLLVNSRNADWLRQVDSGGQSWTFRNSGPLARQNIEGHDVSPTTVDFDGDGAPDFLGGAEDGRFYLLRNASRK